MSPKSKGWAYFGSLTCMGGSQGISIIDFDGETLGDGLRTAKIDDPTHVAVSEPNQMLYAVSHCSSVDGKPGGSLSSYNIDTQTGDLTLAGRQHGLSPHPAYVAIDQSGGWLLTASTMGGAVTVLPIEASGVAGSPSQVVQHHGTAEMAPWPTPFLLTTLTPGAAMTHSAEPSPVGTSVAVADLGLDKLVLYPFDPESGRLDAEAALWIDAPPNSGPRHCVFNGDASIVYLVHEHASSIGVYSTDPDQAGSGPKQTVSSLPDSYQSKNSPADVHLDPTGRFLYVSNRGHNSIVRLLVDQDTAELSDPKFETWNINTPRGFALTPDGGALVVANQDDDSVAWFALDENSGELIPQGYIKDVPSPTCVAFYVH